MKLPMSWLGAIIVVGLAFTAPGSFAQDKVDEKEATDLGIDAYVYGYPLVTMEITRRVMTNVAAPEVNAEGKPYSGANKYVMHFPRGQTPPVNGFWSVTMYNGDYFFVDNPLNKYTVSPRNDLKYNDDGSLDIYIQNESPGKDREANWLPAPKGKFVLMMRLYWPKEKAPSIIDGTWKPPAVKVVGK